MNIQKRILVIYPTWFPDLQSFFDSVQKKSPHKIYFLLLSAKEKNRPWDVDTKNEVKPIVAHGHSLSILKRDTIINPFLSRSLSKINPDIVIIGTWYQLGCFTAKYFTYKNNIPLIAAVVGLNDNPSRGFFGGLRSNLSHFLAKKFIEKSNFVFARGTKAKDDAIKLGAPEDRVVIIKQVIDEKHFDYKNNTLS